ncbi:hypothetical protein E1211_28870 [Micromonospora sp. 15K316]|uniref:hypothetical protein n=1 Tax=Micromonospora sp. 15K316 TaxID=2530376 RepID=UPI00104ECEF5|nr:hypothetical protein [Micromonospora sp. 15K316]TDC27783.1 hypothetical protein E1211_28870 [Micromonospora sp. 15K316]
MGHRLLAVLVRATATVETIDAHLAKPMRPLLRAGVIDGYRLGGQVTGAWAPAYEPAADPNNWRTCPACTGSSTVDAAVCAMCADAERAGRRSGTVVPWSYTDWARNAGDIVALPRLLHPGWRFPPRRTPIAWVDLAGVVWLNTDEAVLTGTDSGRVPPRLLAVFRDLLAGRRNPDPTQPAPRRGTTPAGWLPPERSTARHQRLPGGGFHPADWSVAVVDAHS